MTTAVLQGPALPADFASQSAHLLDGQLDERKRFFRLYCNHKIDPQAVAALRASSAIDINVLPDNFDPRQVKLIVTDMDSTLINIECIDEIADYAGLKAQVAAITEAAMQGELNFEMSLTKRVALLKGLSTNALQHVYEQRLKLNPGAELMLEGLRSRGIKVALVSGGFTYFTDRLKERLQLDFAQGNVIEIIDGKLTGRLIGDIIGAQGKADFLLRVCQEMGISPQQAVAMGDGANDLLMLQKAGLSVAYHAKAKVQQAAHTALNQCGLDGVLGLLDIDI